MLRTDNDGAFLLDDLKVFFKEQDIDLQLCTPYKHGQNGQAERAGRTLKEHAAAMLLDSRMPECFWELAFYAFVYVNNRFPTTNTGDLSPYEMVGGELAGSPHPLPYLPFYSRLVTRLAKSQQTNMTRSRESIMVG